MNLSDLKKAVLARKGKTVEVPEWGISVSFLPIGVHRALGIHAALKLLPTNDTGGITYGQESVAAFVDAISASIANEEGERFLDSEDGRLFLREQSFAVLEQLTAEAMRASGILFEEDDSQKNSPTPAETST